jgi:hypothetical protein
MKTALLDSVAGAFLDNCTNFSDVQLWITD